MTRKSFGNFTTVAHTQDELYQAETLTSQRSVDPSAKEVLRYREALWYGSVV